MGYCIHVIFALSTGMLQIIFVLFWGTLPFVVVLSES